MALPQLNLDTLTAEERLALIERIWNSLESEEVGLTQPQHEELARRLEDLEQNPGGNISWPEAQRRIRNTKP